MSQRIKRILKIDGIEIPVWVDRVRYFRKPKYQYTLGGFEYIWCQTDDWEDAKKWLVALLRDLARAYTRVPFNDMKDPESQDKWIKMHELVDRGLRIRKK